MFLSVSGVCFSTGQSGYPSKGPHWAIIRVTSRSTCMLGGAWVISFVMLLDSALRHTCCQCTPPSPGTRTQFAPPSSDFPSPTAGGARAHRNNNGRSLGPAPLAIPRLAAVRLAVPSGPVLLFRPRRPPFP